MRYILENSILRVEIDSFGAEIKSVKRKDNDREYMWYADKKYWGRTSPVLFPFVGSVNNREYRYRGKTYSMKQHGFARDLEHTMISESGNGLNQMEGKRIWFELKDNEETMEKYPFHFVLQIGYELEGDTVKVLWKVMNPDTKEMYFSIGAHPAFLCPIHGEDSKEGYGIRFAGAKEIIHHGSTPAGEALEKERFVLPLKDETVKITSDFFDRCTYMVPGKQTREVSLLDREGKVFVTVSFDAELFALWSPEGKNAPFVCIEPWYGRCDAKGFQGSLEERPYENKLEGGEVFQAAYKMKFQ